MFFLLNICSSSSRQTQLGCHSQWEAPIRQSTEGLTVLAGHYHGGTPTGTLLSGNSSFFLPPSIEKLDPCFQAIALTLNKNPYVYGKENIQVRKEKFVLERFSYWRAQQYFHNVVSMFVFPISQSIMIVCLYLFFLMKFFNDLVCAYLKEKKFKKGLP